MLRTVGDSRGACPYRSIVRSAADRKGLLLFHLPEEEEDGEGGEDDAVAQHPRKVGESRRKIAEECRPLHLDGMDKG